MKKLFNLSLLGATAITAVSACSNDKKEELVFGVLFNQTEDGLVNNEFKEIAKHIGIALDKDVTIKVLDTNIDAIECAVTGAVDIIMGSTSSYWEAFEQDEELNIITTTAPDGDIDLAGYKSIIGTHVSNKNQWENLTDKEIVENLEGKDASLYSIESTSGGKIPMSYIWNNTDSTDYTMKSDIFESNKFFGNVINTEDHNDTIINVFEGTSEVGAFFDRQLTLTTEKNEIYNIEDMHVIKEIQAPGDPIWGRLASEEANKLNDYLEKLNYVDNSELYQGDTFHFTHPSIQFVRTDQSHSTYQIIKDIDENETR